MALTASQGVIELYNIDATNRLGCIDTRSQLLDRLRQMDARPGRDGGGMGSISDS